MKRLTHICLLALLALAGLTLTGCEGEKDLVVIDKELPIKADTLYMVGDATPAGWSIDSPYGFTRDAQDKYIFTYDGNLNVGEMKCPLKPGDWGGTFFYAPANGTKIGRQGCESDQFAMRSGGNDDKWRVEEAGHYRLTFDLRAHTFKAEYLGAPIKSVDPYKAAGLYLVGDATPAGWTPENGTPCTKKDDYTFVYEGPLSVGEMKLTVDPSQGWGGTWVHAPGEGTVIGKQGVASDDIDIYAGGADHKWRVEQAGIYRLTFDLRLWKLKAEYLGEVPEGSYFTTHLYLFGSATLGQWSLADATDLTQDATDPYLWTYEGELLKGELKCSVSKTQGFEQTFVMPAQGGVTINRQGVGSDALVAHAGEPDNKWNVEEPGRYKISLDLRLMKVKVEYVGQ